MSQKQYNIQEQKQIQQQRLSPLQVQTVRMLEMPLTQMEDYIEQEIEINPSLEADYSHGDDELETYDRQQQSDESERRQDALDDALERIGQDDRMEDTTPLSDDFNPTQNYYEEKNYQEAGSTTSFIENLYEQMREEELNDTERSIMEYLIGSLDNDGLLRKDIAAVSDELAFREGLYVEPEEVEDVLHRLQEFYPPGVGARSLRECLTLQVERMRGTKTNMMMYDVLTKCYDDFINNRWDKICRTLKMSEAQAETVRKEIRHTLNPKPGAAFGEVQGRSLEQVTPDFIVYVNDNGTIAFEMNRGKMPTLQIVQKDEEMIESLQYANSKAEREALAFTQQYVDRGKMFIEAIRQRNETMMRTMKEIIIQQREYILSGDDADLKPMLLKDVAEKTGYDISTISRVSRSKYVQTPWGIVPLKHFFNEGYDTGTGDAIATKTIKNALKEIIEKEDNKSPLSDDKLTAIMKEKGFPIARRTIAKYREQMGIPVARMRKKI